jgi:dephospho-CoA kinase
MIISLFGPDGAGKSTVARGLAARGWQVFSGTNVAEWPDRAWHNELVARGLNEPTIEEDSHFLEKIERVHQLALELSKTNEYVVIDSNPLHKTLMHDYIHALPDRDAAIQRIRNRFVELKKLANYNDDIPRAHVLVLADAAADDETQAALLQKRIQKRGELRHFDPRTQEKSLQMIQACREIVRLLQDNGEQVITVSTDKPLSI